MKNFKSAALAVATLLTLAGTGVANAAARVSVEKANKVFDAEMLVPTVPDQDGVCPKFVVEVDNLQAKQLRLKRADLYVYWISDGQLQTVNGRDQALPRQKINLLNSQSRLKSTGRLNRQVVNICGASPGPNRVTLVVRHTTTGDREGALKLSRTVCVQGGDEDCGVPGSSGTSSGGTASSGGTSSGGTSSGGTSGGGTGSGGTPPVDGGGGDIVFTGETGGALPNFRANCMGVNDGFSYSWDGGALVTDAFKMARHPLQNTYTAPSPSDANGWPVDLTDTNIAVAEGEHDLDKLNPWVLLPYEQSGSWLSGPVWGSWIMSGATHVNAIDYNGVIGHEFNLGPGNNTLKIFEGTIPASPRNRWHLVPKKYAAYYAAAMKAENFDYIFNTDKYGMDLSFPLIHDEAKTQMEPFCRIRYMLGDSINSLDFSGKAADRNTPAHPTFNTPGGDGIPYEWETWIANHLGVNVYHADHVKTWDALQTGDTYLNQQASYFANNLRGNIIREYGNEIWNTAPRYAPQTFWVWEKGPYDDPGRTNYKWMHHNYGARAYDTAAPWLQAFAGNRDKLDLSISLHTSWPSSLLWRFQGPNGEDWTDRADSIGGTWYFGSPVVPGNDRYNDIVANGQSAVVSQHQTELAGIKTQLSQIFNLSDGFVDRYHLYEGGSHMFFINHDRFNAEHVQVLADHHAYLNSPAYTNHLNNFANWWEAQPNTGELVWFNLYGRNTPDEPWGYYQSTANPTTNFSGGTNFLNGYSNF